LLQVHVWIDLHTGLDFKEVLASVGNLIMDFSIGN
jgi:hypothetical protein